MFCIMKVYGFSEQYWNGKAWQHYASTDCGFPSREAAEAERGVQANRQPHGGWDKVIITPL